MNLATAKDPPHEKGRPTPQKAPLNYAASDTHRKHTDTAPGNFRKAGNFDEPTITALFASRYLSNLSESMAARSSRANAAKAGPWLLPPIPRIVVKTVRDSRGHVSSFNWFDSGTGVGGSGAVTLAAHVLKTSKSEAARRASHFLAVTLSDGEVSVAA